MRRTVLIMSLFLVAAANAYAQPADRGYVQAIGGLTFGTEGSNIFGGGVGISLGRHVQVVLDGGRMNDIVPSSLRRELDAGARELEDEFGVPVTIRLRAPATYFTGGVRLLAPGPGRVTPFVTFSAGSARIDPRLSIAVQGVNVPVTEEELTEAGIVSGANTLVGIGGGFEIAVSRRLGLELGYQYNRIFIEEPSVNMHRAFTGVNVRF
jgi:opacity protein-like surface antigen